MNQVASVFPYHTVPVQHFDLTDASLVAGHRLNIDGLTRRYHGLKLLLRNDVFLELSYLGLKELTFP